MSNEKVTLGPGGLPALKAAIDELFKRIHVCQMAGGIGEKEVDAGAVVPAGWVKDNCGYWIPRPFEDLQN